MLSAVLYNEFVSVFIEDSLVIYVKIVFPCENKIALKNTHVNKFVYKSTSVFFFLPYESLFCREKESLKKISTFIANFM